MVKCFRSFNKYYVSRKFPDLIKLVWTPNGLVAFDDIFDYMSFIQMNSGLSDVKINGKTR